ncbi:MAG: hypothetical protein M1825_004983 [Sarcosagium campestre]|nr:MAG: hypothetical protein M1825_004983 [Sarcosagium campestre]
MVSTPRIRLVGCLLPVRRPFVKLQACCRYYSDGKDGRTGSPSKPVKSKILDAALEYVPEYGFTKKSISLGAQKTGYLDVTANLFPAGAFDLIRHHLVKQRLALKHPPTPKRQLDAYSGSKNQSVGSEIQRLAWRRLRANATIVHRWQEALAVMAQPSNVPSSFAELARLSDEICFLAGDSSVDTSWYTKRAGVSAAYSSSELYMTQDTSQGYSDTHEFLERRLAELWSADSFANEVGDWLNFTRHAVVNVLRSKGVRI